MILLKDLVSICYCQHLCIKDVDGLSLANVTDEIYDRIKNIPVSALVCNKDGILDVKLGVTRDVLLDMSYNPVTELFSDKRKKYYVKNRDKILKNKREKYKEEKYGKGGNK